MLIGVFGTLLGCAEQTANSQPKLDPTRPRIVCTTSQVADLVRNLAGPEVQIQALMGPGVDPHLYRGNFADMKALRQSELVFHNGLHLEGRLSELLESLAKDKPVFAITDGLLEKQDSRLRPLPGTTDMYDPHVWFDIDLWADCGRLVTQKLIEFDPDHADEYQQRAEKYQSELAQLSIWCRQQLASIPTEQRVLVTAHDAFGYFGAAYDVEVHGLQGISTADEADLATVRQLVDLLVDRQIKAVFVESSVPSKNVQSLIEACEARGHRVRQGGELYSDALGPANARADTYVGMVRHNVDTIVKALK
jgi:manganese/zinc/iron transport system substrate-binding protein